LTIATLDEVITTRPTPAARAARSARKVPSTAGRISICGSSGWLIGNGEAAWITASTPVIAPAQPRSSSRSSVTKLNRSSSPAGSSSTGATAARTSAARASPRTDPMTWHPAFNSFTRICLAI